MKLLKSTLVLLLCLIHIVAISQNSNFQSYPDFEISISPDVPKICSGEPTKVECNEDFDSYEWEGVGFEYQAFGQQVELTEYGQYTLTIKGEVDGIPYFKILNFYTESKDSDNDGVCDQDDCLPSNPFVAIGIACDDGNDCTENDVFNSNCECVGTPISNCDDIGQASASDILELKIALRNSFLAVIPAESQSAKLVSIFDLVSTTPHAEKLLEDDVKIEIKTLPSSDLITLLSDIADSRYSPGYLGNDLNYISEKKIRAWHGLSKTPIAFRTKSSIQDSVAMYMQDFNKGSKEISLEIANAKKGQTWWYSYVLGRKYWISYLEDFDNIKAFANEILAFNKETEGGGNILSGSPSSAINTALYYDDVLEQGASIFKTIVKNHMFYDGNKRTAASTIKSFMLKSGIPINKTDRKIFKLAKKVATDKVVEVSDIANKLIK